MPLSKNEIAALMRLVGLTQEDEIDCEQCLRAVAEFTEQRLAGRSIADGLRAVEQHLSICGECCEEYEALQRALKAMDG